MKCPTTNISEPIARSPLLGPAVPPPGRGGLWGGYGMEETDVLHSGSVKECGWALVTAAPSALPLHTYKPLDLHRNVRCFQLPIPFLLPDPGSLQQRRRVSDRYQNAQCRQLNLTWIKHPHHPQSFVVGIRRKGGRAAKESTGWGRPGVGITHVMGPIACLPLPFLYCHSLSAVVHCRCTNPRPLRGPATLEDTCSLFRFGPKY